MKKAVPAASVPATNSLADTFLEWFEMEVFAFEKYNVIPVISYIIIRIQIFLAKEKEQKFLFSSLLTSGS